VKLTSAAPAADQVALGAARKLTPTKIDNDVEACEFVPFPLGVTVKE
jgi:hypothetical protein